MKFADNLKLIRQQRKMTQTAVAEKLHVARQTVSSWENERSYPDIGMLVKISEVYGLSVDQLLKGDLGMLKHYETQTALGKRGQRTLRNGYYLMVPALFLNYLGNFLHWQGGLVVMVDLFLMMIVLTLIFQYPDFKRWVATPRQRWGLVAIIVMVGTLNLALSLPVSLVAVPGNVGNVAAYELGRASGLIVGAFIRIFIRTIAFVLAVEIPFQRRKTE
ncbi:XRE family transcriptional regulator [Lactiplantibacillus garii]|uniref:XRE family transcriptional regulator n=1 Tax=Lactiplantibacillus garii TaxID=2306423 RepID=A0A3R8KGU6_9LACO|nr:helix-turn-helix transcriptional regulator [Lactiplantibacillus garii]RRK09570.1 XRE family transcriptional regulator [Lactiplantibacillus garii]